MDRRSAGRQAGLLLVAFVATLALLVGGRALLARIGAGADARTSPSPLTSAGGGSPSAAASPAATVPPPAAPDASDVPAITLIGAGDIADCSLDGAKRTSDVILGQPGWVFTAGDNAYEDGSAPDFSQCYAPTWGRLLDRTILPAAGNHDWNTDGASGYRGYFGARAAPDGVTWYSMTIGTWHVIVLDSDCANVGGCDAGSEQGRWLASDLEANPVRCTMAIWHHPRFTSGEHGNDPDVAPFWDQLHGAHADLVINGHDHDYERFAPQDPAGNEERPGGIREIVVGTGGAELRSFKRTVANSEFRLSGTYGVLRLTLHPFNYDWEYLPLDGRIADSGSTACR